MRIGQLAELSGIPPNTIRFWESVGLVAEPARTPSGYRDYDPTTVDRLEFIRHGQAAGLTLAEIRQVLAISDNGEPPCDHVTHLIHQHLADVTHRIRELQEARDLLSHLAQRAADQDPADCDGYCAILQPSHLAPGSSGAEAHVVWQTRRPTDLLGGARQTREGVGADGGGL
jgi:MerR family transcriptional regulator, copper efflux regulator